MAANRTKTIEYAWNSNTSSITVTNNIATTPTIDLGAITVDIEETTSRTFQSGMIVWGFRDNATVINLNRFNICRISLNIDGGGYTNFDLTQFINEFDENQAIYLQRDVLSFFTAYSSNSHSIGCQAKVVNNSVGNVPINNTWAKLMLTYDYDDSAHDIVTKTVRIPIGARDTALPTSLTEIGTNQVPALNTFLPEVNKTYKQIFFEFVINKGGPDATDTTLEVSLDAEGGYAFGQSEGALQSDTLDTYIWNRSDINTSTTHAFKARCIETTNNYVAFGGLLNVTYTYDVTNSSSVMNSIIIPSVDDMIRLPILSNGIQYDETKFEIMEPGPITLAQSAILFYTGHYIGQNYFFKAGSQSAYIQYITSSAGTEMVGNNTTIVHRVDLNNGLTITRGTNTLKTFAYAQIESYVGKMETALLLNYTSGIHEDGEGAHNHTVYWHLMENQIDSGVQGDFQNETIMAPTILENNYWLTGVGAKDNTHSLWDAGLFIASLNSGEFQGNGWMTMGIQASRADFEIGYRPHIYNWKDKVKLYPEDPGTKMNIESTRIWKMFLHNSSGSPGFHHMASYIILTYHSIIYTISGNITGYTGDGSGIPVEIWSNNTSSKILDATTSSGGGYSATWYSDLSNVFATARQNSVLLGRSNSGNPS